MRINNERVTVSHSEPGDECRYCGFPFDSHEKIYVRKCGEIYCSITCVQKDIEKEAKECSA